jgi:hypothetical protein
MFIDSIPLKWIPKQIAKAQGWIQVVTATVNFVFAQEERDTYSHESTRKDLAPLGAKPGVGTIGDQGKRLRSSGASE